MSSTRIGRHVKAPRAAVYRALLDAQAVERWMVPTGMTSRVHAFDPREGGSFRISLTYDAPTGTGKTTAHTDTFHGRFVKLVTNERVVEGVEFETTDPALQGEMTITISLVDADGGTDLIAVHDGLPSGLSPADNEAGWRLSLEKLAALVEASEARATQRVIGIAMQIEAPASARGTMMGWKLAYHFLWAAFLLTAALNLLHVRAGFLTSHLADLTVPALLYVLSRGLVPGKGLHPHVLMRIVGRTPASAATILFLASTATELSQVFWPRGFFAGRFDPLDIVSYAAGLMVCYGFDKVDQARAAAANDQVRT